MSEMKMKETIDKVAESVKGAVDMAADSVKNVAENETVKETVENAKKTAKKVAESEPAKNVKKTAQKVSENEKLKSVTKSAKKAAKKQYTKLALQETYIQYFGHEIRESEILEKVEEDYKANGHRLSSIKTLKLYIKPEDGAAYYVINDKFTGSVEL